MTNTHTHCDDEVSAVRANEKLVTKTVRFSIMARRLVFESNAVRCACVCVCVCVGVWVCVRKSATESTREASIIGFQLGHC